MPRLTLDTIAENLSYFSFNIFVDGMPQNDSSPESLHLLKDYLANLAVEGAICSWQAPQNPLDVSATLGDATAMPLEVMLFRSRGVIDLFTAACLDLERVNVADLNGHAPTFFAASRIAQLSDSSLSTIMSHGGLNILTIYDTLISRNGRRDVYKDPRRQNEASDIMRKPNMGAKSAPVKSLREVLSAEELRVFEQELAALKSDRAAGTIPKMSYAEAIEAVVPSID